jgi:hypothetical protein
MAVISNAKGVSSIPLYETEHGFATNTERSLVWRRDREEEEEGEK